MTAAEARRAGRALFDVTRATGAARPTLDGLLAFQALVVEHDELAQVVRSPFVTGDAKRGVIERIAGALNLAPAAASTLRLLAEQQELDGLDGLIKELKTQVHRQERRVDAEVTTAVPLDEARVAQLRDALSQATGQQVSLSARVDPAVIGGAVTRVGSVVYDGSLARQLARMKEQFVKQG
ncbi:MAG TPA: ATP synthase F1 subunit delta [Luteitalea sp.]|nr:ATP synthase F1 subunit delta [Luteitalea sp.]